MRYCLVLVLHVFVLLPAVGQAAIEEYPFAAEEDQERFKQLVYELRCPKCMNSNLAGSDAPIATDLRNEVYRQINEGRSDKEIIEFMTSRYGDFILYRPPLNPGTFLLWFGPAILLLVGFFIIRRSVKQNADAETALSDEERRRLDAILASKEKDQA